MPKAVLTISSRNYGAWALRGWLMAKLAKLDFTEHVVPPDDPAMKAEILLLSSSMLVPSLQHQGLKVWDTLAIGEYLHEIKPKAGLLPADVGARAMNLSFMGGVSAILKVLQGASVMILVIMMLILGNTIAMGARERVNQFGVMRAIGFMPRHVAASVLGEALVLGLIGGGLGVLLAYPLVERGMGRFIEENMGSYFPYFRISDVATEVALLLAVLLGLCAALIPAYRSARLNVIDALRRVG